MKTKKSVFTAAVDKVIDLPDDKPTIHPMKPSDARKELEQIEWIYEHTSISTADYEAAKARIMASLAAWGKQ